VATKQTVVEVVWVHELLIGVTYLVGFGNTQDLITETSLFQAKAVREWHYFSARRCVTSCPLEPDACPALQLPVVQRRAIAAPTVINMPAPINS
jgi:hypothetical protein